jgi:Uncharacterized protein conserved in bacteria
MKKRVISLLLAICIIAGAFQFNSATAHAWEGYSIYVNCQTNTVTVYSGSAPIKGFLCSTGAATPLGGTYYLEERYRWQPLFGDVYGQYATVITGNILFHSVPYTSPDPSALEYWEYDKLGTSASMGCVRLTVRDAQWIYENCPEGTPVTFYQSSDPGPYGKRNGLKISKAPEPFRNWDPTDPDPNNPWNNDSSYYGKAYDPYYYVNNNPDVEEKVYTTLGNQDAILKVDWLTEGIRNTKRASEIFDLKTYKENYPELEEICNDNYDYVQYYNNEGYFLGHIANVSFKTFKQELIFDADYYAARYRDLYYIFGNDSDKLFTHFIKYGIKEGRQASPIFDISFYKNTYGDLKAAFGDDVYKYVLHFLNHGIYEGRRASTVYDTNYYKNKYADLRGAFGNNNIKYAEHYLKYGLKEGRQASPAINVNFYKGSYNDLKAAFGNDNKKYIAHFQSYGIREGRAGSELFDINVYKQTYKDLQYAFGDNYTKYLEHFINYGYNEGRKAAVLDGKKAEVFDAHYYADKYKDLKGAFGYDEDKLFAHFLRYGIREGRQASPKFSVKAYKNRYADLRYAFGDNYDLYLKHYIKYGLNEHRKGN